LLSFSEAQLIQRRSYFSKKLLVINAWSSETVALIQKIVSWSLLGSWYFWGTESIKYMKTAFFRSDVGDSWFLKKVAFDVSPFDRMVWTKINLHILSKATGVFVADSFAISESFEDRVTGEYFIRYRMLLFFELTKAGEHLHAIFSGLCLPSTWFSWYDYGLLLYLVDHSLKSTSSYCVNMRLFERISWKDNIFNLLNDLWIVESRDDFIGIEGDESRSYAGVDLILLVTKNEIVEDILLCEIVHQAHVIVVLHFCLINNNS